jgi:hypothetical protein
MYDIILYHVISIIPYHSISRGDELLMSCGIYICTRTRELDEVSEGGEVRIGKGFCSVMFS